MAIIAISYCASLAMPQVQTNLSEVSPAPGAALPSISDVIFEDQKRMLKPFLWGAKLISLSLCLLGMRSILDYGPSIYHTHIPYMSPGGVHERALNALRAIAPCQGWSL